MRRLQIKFPNQIRISGWDFGSSARAMNQAGGVISAQAELVKVISSTTERKSMSTKTTIKRIALVAVSALGIGVLTSVAPAKAATTFNASMTAPTSLNLKTGYSATDAGSIQIDLASLDTQLLSTNTATVTMTGDSATVLAKFSLSETNTAGTATYSSTTATGYNGLNGGVVAFNTTTATVAGSAGGYATASGKVYVKVAAGLTAAASGSTITFTLTTSSSGVVKTFPIVMTIYIDRKAGTATSTPSTGVGTILAGGSASATTVQPYTNVPANDAWTSNFTLSGAAASSFTVTAVATGGSVTMVTDSATSITANLVKSPIAGDFSVTYTITVNALSSAAAGSTVSAGGYTWTVQPTTPTYSYSVVTPAADSTNGYYKSAASGGDGIIWSRASDKTNAAAAFTVVQYDQTASTITAAAYAAPVSVTVTGKGSLSAITGTADVVTKSKAWTVTNGQLTSGTTTFSVYSEGTSGEGTVSISVNGAVVKTYTVRFLGDAAKITATLLRPIGSTAGAENGVDSSTASTSAFGISGVATVGATNAPSIAVKVLDANGWAIPTAAPTATISDLTVVQSTRRSFIDSGISSPADYVYSAGTFTNHFFYTTNANASGKTATIKYSFVNAAGTVLTTDPVTVTLGGAVVKSTVAFDETSYAPGAAVTITFSGFDASGNKAYDGQDLVNGGFTSSLDFGGANNALNPNAWTTAKIVNGVKVRTTYAPIVPGTWSLEAATASGVAATATATVTDLAAVATDAANEATDAANAATDAANAAAEAADAATAAAQDAQAAVAELATKVASLIAGIKAQITTLTNLVIKIQKKVRA